MSEPDNSLSSPFPPVNKYRKRTKTFEQRFWEKVDKTSSPHGCWLWRGQIGKDDYGVGWLGKAQKAHRLSWYINNGPIPIGLLVLHNCPGGDNPSCVNPDHLWLGTNAQNAEDMVKKGRQAKGVNHGSVKHPETILRGSKNGHSKLNEDIVRKILSEYAKGHETLEQLANIFSVGKSTIWKIVRRQMWNHV